MYGLSTQNNRLNILELHRKMNQRNEKKSVCYEKVLEICNKRISTQAERDKTHCLFEFPEYVAGYPLFDLNACIQYCEKQLVSNGFLVKYYFPNKFYISWDFEEIKKHKEEQRKKTPLLAVLPQGNGPSNNASGNKQLTLAPNQLPPPISQSATPHAQQQVPSQQHMSISLQQIQQMQPSLPPQVPSRVQSQIQSQAHLQVGSQTQPHTPEPMQQAIVPAALHAKMTAPLPTSLPKYDPFDLYTPSIHSPRSANGGGSEQTEGKKASAIDNSFFANSFKQTLASGIGSTKMFDYKPSGKLTLNI